MSTSRKFFSEVCTLGAAAATRVGTLMAANGWGFEPGTNNSITTIPSLDSTNGTFLSVKPLGATVYIGHDQYVRNAAGAGPPRVYKGITVASGALYTFQDFHKYGIIDIKEVWLYCVGGDSVEIIFKGI